MGIETTMLPIGFQNHSFTAENEPVNPDTQVYWEQVIGQWIGWIWMPTVIPIGYIGNLLAFLVMIQKHNRGNSCCVYMAGLAFSDTVVLMEALGFFLRTLPYPWSYYTVLTCKIEAYVFQAFSANIMFLCLRRPRIYGCAELNHCSFPDLAGITNHSLRGTRVDNRVGIIKRRQA